MPESLFHYQCVLKIPVDNLAAGLSYKSQLDDQIKQGIESVLTDGAKLECKVAGDAPGFLSASIIRGGQTISVTGRFGQNATFTSSGKASFISYSIRAELFSAAMDRVDAVGEHFVLIGKIIGAIVAPIPVVWALFAFAEKTGVLVVWALPGVLAALFGIWCGGRIAEGMAGRLESHVHNQSVESGEADEMATLWKRLTNQLESISSQYEKV